MKKYLRVVFSILFFFLSFITSSAQQTVLNGATTTPINFPDGACVYNWTNNNTSIGLAASGTGNIPSFAAINAGSSPVTATITATPTTGRFAYVPNSGDGTVSVVNMTTNTVESTIQVGSFPFAVAASPDGSRVYVTNEYSKTVSVINTADNTVVATIAVGALPDGVAVSPDGTRAYITNNSNNLTNGVNTVSVINTLTNSVVSTVPVGPNPLGVAVSPDGAVVYIANSDANTVSVIQTATNTVSATISVGTHPFGVCFSPDGSKAYVTNQDAETVSVINTATETVMATVSVGLSPYGICCSPDGKHVYVANLSGNSVSVINTALNNVTSTIPVGALPYGICISPDGNSVYVAIRGTNSISTINTTTNTVSSSAIVGTEPYSFGNFITNGSPCSGAPVTFTITVNPSAQTITAGTASGAISACVGAASASPNIQQFTISVNGLTANITATAPAGFEVSLAAGIGYGSSVTIPQTSGAVNSAVVYVRSAATASAGSISGAITLSSAGASNQTVAVTATVNALPTVNAVANQTVLSGAATTAVNFTGTGNSFTWVNDTPGIGLAANGSGDISSFTALNTGNSPVTATITATPLSAGYAYINNVDDNNVSVINTVTNMVVLTIPVGTQPIGIAVTPDGTKVYVTNSGSGTVSVISTQTNTVIATIPVGAYPFSAVVSTDGKLVYIANENDGSISIISTATNTIKSTVKVGMYAQYVAESPDGSRLYISDFTDSLVYVFDTATNTVIASITCPHQPYGLCVSNDGTTVFVANYYSNNISLISTASNTVVSSILTDQHPEAIVESPDGKWLYVINTNSADLSVIDLSTNLLSVNIPVGGYPQSVSITADGRFLYVPGSASSTQNVSVIDTKTNTVIATVPVGKAPISFGNFIKNSTGCNGTPIKFTITVNPSTPTVATTPATGTITACTGAASASPTIQQFTVSGTGLTGNITATAPPGGAFEISLTSGSGYGSAVTITQTSGAVSSTIVYVRSAATASTGSISGNVLLTSPGAPDQTVSVTGTVDPVAAASLIISASGNNICAGTPIIFTATPTNGGSTPAYQWLLNGGNTGTNSPSFSTIPADGDVVSCVMKSSLACAVPASITSNSITAHIFPLPVVKGGGNKTLKKGNSIAITATKSGNIADITWSPLTGLDNNKILNPKANPIETTLYTVTVQTAEGCMATDSVTVTVFDGITIPNTFTPNGDGVNDKWEIQNLKDYLNCTVHIFDRWGTEVYSSTGYYNAWDGTLKGRRLPVGTYYYIINLNDGTQPTSGFVVLIR